MHEDHSHGDLIESITDQYGEVMEESGQAIYIYLDDEHKVCNRKFAKLLGYSSPGEWAKVEGSFPDAFVALESQETLVDTYRDAMEKFVSATVPITWKKKSGGTVKTTVNLVPIVHEGHLLALHFIS